MPYIPFKLRLWASLSHFTYCSRTPQTIATRLCFHTLQVCRDFRQILIKQAPPGSWGVLTIRLKSKDTSRRTLSLSLADSGASDALPPASIPPIPWADGATMTLYQNSLNTTDLRIMIRSLLRGPDGGRRLSRVALDLSDGCNSSFDGRIKTLEPLLAALESCGYWGTVHIPFIRMDSVPEFEAFIEALRAVPRLTYDIGTLKIGTGQYEPKVPPFLSLPNTTVSTLDTIVKAGIDYSALWGPMEPPLRSLVCWSNTPTCFSQLSGLTSLRDLSIVQRGMVSSEGAAQITALKCLTRLQVECTHQTARALKPHLSALKGLEDLRIDVRP